MEQKERQIKSKERVAKHGEVFTNEREVNAMIDLVWGSFLTDYKKITSTFLEPACGSGNFLVAILQRKLDFINEKYSKDKDRFLYELSIIRAICSIYGVELQEDNTQECRERLYQMIEQNYLPQHKKTDNFPKILGSVAYILSQNIINGNALDYTTRDRKPIIFTQWDVGENGYILIDRTREQEEMVEQAKQELHYNDRGEEVFLMPINIKKIKKNPPSVHYLTLGDR